MYMSNSSHHLAEAWLYRVGRYRRCKIPLRTPSPGSLNTQDWKNCDFRSKSPFISKMVSCQSIRVGSVTLKGRMRWVNFFFWQMSIITPVYFDLEWQNLARQQVMKVMRMIQPRTHSKGRDLSVLQNFWNLLHACTQYEKQQPNFARWSN